MHEDYKSKPFSPNSEVKAEDFWKIPETSSIPDEDSLTSLVKTMPLEQTDPVACSK